MTKQHSSLIHRFNTQSTDDETIIALQTGREDDVKKVVDKIEHNLSYTDGQMQHVLIKAPRGYGKSYLTRLVNIEMKNKPVEFIFLPEELLNIRVPTDLLREINRHISGKQWTTSIVSWNFDDDWHTEANKLAITIKQHLDDTKKMIVVVLENFDSIVNRYFKSNELAKTLRKWLSQEKSHLMLLATTTTSIDKNYNEPLFQQFEEIELKKWKDTQCIEYFKKLRTYKNLPEMDASLLRRAKALSQFINGIPRLSRILGDSLDTVDIDGIADMLDSLIDELNDYYQQNLGKLSPKAVHLLDALIKQGEPCSQSELAERVGTQQANISAAFAELKTYDIVTDTKIKIGNQKLFRVTDRLLAHYYRTRFSGEHSKVARLTSIADLLMSFFSLEERLEKAASEKAAGRSENSELLSSLRTPEDELKLGKTRSYRAKLKKRIEFYLKYLHPNTSTNKTDLELTLYLLEDKAETVQAKAIDAIKTNETVATQHERLIKLIWLIIRANCVTRCEYSKHWATPEHLIADTPELKCIFYRERANYYWFVEPDKPKAIEDFRQAGQLTTKLHDQAIGIKALVDKAFVEQLSNDKEQNSYAIDHYKQAIEAALEHEDIAEQASILRKMASAQIQLCDYKAAKQNITEAISLCRELGDIQEQARALCYAVYIHLRLEQFDEAIKCGYETEILANSINDYATLIQTMRFMADAFHKHDEPKKALDYAQKALHTIDEKQPPGASFEKPWLIMLMLQIGDKRQVDNCVELFEQLLVLNQQENSNLPKWQDAIEPLLKSVMYSNNWQALLTLINSPSQLNKIDIVHCLQEKHFEFLGEYLNKLAVGKNRPVAFKSLVDVIELVQSAQVEEQVTNIFSKIVTEVVQALLIRSDNAEFLKEAGVLLGSHSSKYELEAELLSAVADFFEDNNNTATRKRIDPDIDIALNKIKAIRKDIN